MRSLGTLDGPLRRAVHRLKYRGRSGAARTLAGLLVPLAAELTPGRPAPAAVLIPVPLDPGRERQRGYNQAALLARPLAGALRLPCAPGLLRRRRPTLPQVGLSRARRWENVRDAFQAHPDVSGREVLLVDDVTTTGSTLGSAAGACRAAGALRVSAITLAREL